MGKKWAYLILAFLVLGPAWAAQATSGPIGWWTFDEKSGTTAADSSANKNNGTLTGGVTWATGQIGGAVQCGGTNGYVSLPIGALISKLTSTTIATWANYSQAGGAWQRIFDFGTGTTFYMFLTPAQGGSNTGNMRFAITTGSNGAESQLNAPSRLATGWHHVAVAIDGSTRAMQMFLDGAVVANATTNTLPNALGNTNQNWLGRSQWADAYYQGSLDDFRIYDRALTAAELQTVMKGGGMGTATSPAPADQATDVVRGAVLSWKPGQFAKTHDVYLGTSFADVNSASRTEPRGVLASQGQDANSYDPPGVLALDTTYYWRVDEVNAVPTTIFKGSVWSFTTEPVSIPIKTVTATASSATAGSGPEKTIDGSGLTGTDQHSTSTTDMWVSGKGTLLPAWIQYTFDKTYKLDKMLVWNSNQAIESLLGFGAKAVTVEYSADGTTWKTLGDFEFARAPGTPDYKANTTVDFKGAAAVTVKLTIKSNWGGMLPTVSLSEVRFQYLPVWARQPSPAAGATAVNPQIPLTWRPGREAAAHQVYLSTDKQKVLDGTAPAVTVTTPQYPAPVTLGQTYYWKVTEVNEAMTPSTWEGDVWSFTTRDSLVVDDFESYNDDDQRIYDAWIDGTTDGKSGSFVGNNPTQAQLNAGTGHFAETVIVHSGKQSMPMTYNNNAAPRYSEATRTFTPAQDWTQYGITTLVLWFRGDPNNTAAPLYAKINDAKVQYNSGAPSTASQVWKQWNIDLASVGTSLKSVKSLVIGVGNGSSGGAGTIYVDDLLLYATAPQVVAPADPGTNGLVLLYAMEGNVQDTSGKGNHGTLNGTGTYVNGPNGYGKALQFNGLDNYVTLPIGNLLSTLSNITVATWVNRPSTVPSWERIWDFGNGPVATANNYMFLTAAQGTTGPMTFGIMTPTVAEKRCVAPSILPTGWHHVAVALDGTAKIVTLYLDGSAVASTSVTVLPKDLGVTTNNCIGRSQWSADAFFNGAIDDFRIYNRAASAAEIRYLAGDR